MKQNSNIQSFQTEIRDINENEMDFMRLVEKIAQKKKQLLIERVDNKKIGLKQKQSQVNFLLSESS